MTTTTLLGPMVGIWLGLLIMLIYTWTWIQDDYIGLVIWILLGIPIYYWISNIWKDK